VNAKVTTWWKTGNQKETVEMPEDRVAGFLAGLPKGELKGYIVDAAPSDIQPRAPIPFEVGDAVITGGGHPAVFIGTDPKYPDLYVVRLEGFRADYVLVNAAKVRKA
jgi:hypothetical protein